MFNKLPYKTVAAISKRACLLVDFNFNYYKFISFTLPLIAVFLKCIVNYVRWSFITCLKNA